VQGTHQASNRRVVRIMESPHATWEHGYAAPIAAYESGLKARTDTSGHANRPGGRAAMEAGGKS
jgi:hypothetical protein